VEGTASRTTPEGASVEVPFRFELDPSRADPAAALAAPGGDLAAAARRVAEAALASAPRPGAPDSAAEPPGALDAFGIVAGSFRVDPARPRGSRDHLAALREAYAGPRRPVVVVGIDGADWAVMGPMMERGELPHLAALRSRGAWGVLRSATPTLSPLLWTTIATGKTPDQHGIVDFLAIDPATGRQAPITSRFRRSKALWTILTDLGLPSLTVGWWATWPAEPVSGFMVTDRVAYSLFDPGGAPSIQGAVHPPGTASRIAGLVVGPGEVDFEAARAVVGIDRPEFDRARASLAGPDSWRDPVAHLLRILAATRTYHQIALALLREGQPPLTLVYYEGLDEVNHRFAHYADPPMRWADPAQVPAFRGAVEAFYRLQDRLVGEIVAAASTDTVILVVSDHGFASGSRRPTEVPPDIEGKPGRWHTLEGVILAAGPPVRKGRMARDPGILDVAPTVLALLSLPAAEDMPGAAIPEVAPPGSPPAPTAARIPTYEAPAGAAAAAPAGRLDAPGGPEAAASDEEMIAKLTALGYLGGTPAAGGAPSESGAGDGAPGSGAPGGSPGTVTGHVNAGNVHFVRRDYAAAEREYRAALALAPEYVPARMGLAQSLIAAGREVEGWGLLRDVLAAGRDLDPHAYAKVARFYRARRRSRDGADLFASLPRRGELEPARLAALGSLLADAGDAAGAERAFRESLALDPAFEAALEGVYALLAPRRAYADLAALLEPAVKAAPRAPLPANLLALTYERAGRAQEAASVLRRALEANPRDLRTLTNFAGVLIRLGDAAGAVPLLERARDVDPSSLETLVNLVVAQGRLKDLDAARRTFGAAGEAAARPALMNAMAYACFLNGALDDARALLAGSLGRDPDQEEARRMLAAVEAAAAAGRPSSSAPGPGL
jgi:predicted AlkP superfamily phosphohydrolase/phosphomutase/tetratricopeptide (TPR) repeat protein